MGPESFVHIAIWEPTVLELHFHSSSLNPYLTDEFWSCWSEYAPYFFRSLVDAGSIKDASPGTAFAQPRSNLFTSLHCMPNNFIENFLSQGIVSIAWHLYPSKMEKKRRKEKRLTTVLWSPQNAFRHFHFWMRKISLLHQVIYGDTDSVMVQFGVPTIEAAMSLGKEAAEYISSTFTKV